ncbi:protein expanded isoform X2 [Planococcus citri]|uniref:protein expanded isoform X2 n=1 Tax=Planococcus citri TaxID=170843 RepID=UPI0031F86A68
MRHSTVSAPIESCNVSSLSTPALRFCAVHLLHGQVLYFVVEPKSKTKELYNQACAHLASQGMLDTDLFGLAVISDGEYLFVDPDYKLSKYAPKSWRSSSTHGLDNSGKPLLAFYFRVQFYVDNPLLLRDETSRHHYYLQLRHNVVYRSLVYTYVAEEIIYLLVGLALQAEFGDYLESQHTENYFSLQEYFPQQMVAHGNETKLYQNAAVVHKANRTLSKAQAETQFIREASSRDSFPLAHNSHLYRLKQKKHDPNPGTLWLAICTRGIELYEERSNKPISGTFCWNNIGKLCFDRKKFEIRSLNPAGERYVYYTNSDEKSKHLLTLCRLTHQFCMSIQLRLNEITRKEEEEKNQYRDWGSELSVKLTEMCYNHNADQRISVISTTSSNTTSGIVSDRVHSLDESEDDLDMEIMINSPPAASIESLALAHLRDSFNTENRKINKIVARSSPAYHNSVGAQDENSDLCCLSKLTLPTTPAPTDDSQCSSSCSTIVVTGYGHDKAKTQQETTGLSSNRRHSTSSSLELGYSHTAQNSALSDSASCCLELDYSVQSAHTSSGIYTLQSSCETNTVATTAAAASSETSGIGHSVVEDSEGIRSRSGSIVSASGSFHGDGSDPSDTGHGTPLTAEELSDLIVGRSPKPCRGKYPSVATVSESLDSIADYVTLPPPPIPPPRRTPLMESMSRHNLGGAFSSKSSDTTSSYVARQGSISTASHSESNKNYFSSEEAMLQRQIQFQHLTGGFSSHLLMDTIAPANQIQMQMQMQPTSAKMLMCASNDDIAASNIDSGYSSCYPVASTASASSVASAVSAPLLKSKFQQNHKSCISLPLRSEEASARIVSTKPQINVLKAQSSYVPSGSLIPSYASPAAINYNVPTSACRSTSLQQQQHQHHQHQHQQLQQPPQIQPNYHQKYTTDVSTRLDYAAAAAAAAAANQVPIVGSNNYLDVRRSGVAFLQQIHEKFPPPPPLLYSRQPPPPPPPPRNHYSMCNNNLLSHQIDQYKQQLYSDVDYVIYPMKDPAISKQEYLDSKEASFHCNQHYLSQSSLSSRYARPFPSTYNVFAPPAAAPTPYSLYGGRKSQAMYRSTPNVAVAGGGCISSYCQHAANARYASNQNLSAELSGYSNSSLAYLSAKHASSTSPLYSAAASMYSSSMQSLRLDSSIYGRILPSSSNCSFSRTRSDDNILNCGDRINVDHHLDVKFRKPPPPPPPPYNSQKHYICSERVRKPDIPPPELTNSRVNQTEVNSPPKDKNISLDICSLREKSKDLDLPLISALCNDKSLLKQTNTIDLASEQPNAWYNDTDENIPKDESLVAKASNNKQSLYSVDSNSSQSNDRTSSTSKSTTSSKNNNNNNKSSPFRSISKSIVTTMGTPATSATRNAIAPKIFDRSKFLSCDIPKVIESQASYTEPAHSQSTAKVKSSSKLINSKLSKASTSANKLKYPVSQPINKVTKIKSASISENNLKLKFKSLKIKSEDATQRNGSGDLDKAS